MIFTLAELIAIGAMAIVYHTWDANRTYGEEEKIAKTHDKVVENKGGAQVEPNVVNLMEYELIKRGVQLPERIPTNPGRYQAELSLLLDETALLATAYKPIRSDKLEEYGGPSWRTAGKVLTDMIYFRYPREPVRPPDAYYHDP